jgi:hypothetical protein
MSTIIINVFALGWSADADHCKPDDEDTKETWTEEADGDHGEDPGSPILSSVALAAAGKELTQPAAAEEPAGHEGGDMVTVTQTSPVGRFFEAGRSHLEFRKVK